MAKIVVIDDDSFILESVCDVLELQGYDVSSFLNGWEAIDFIKNNPTDLVISDIDMPTIKGYEVLNILKSEIKTSLIPFIFLTGMDKDYQVREGMVLGADDYITKPFDSNDIINSVKARLSKKVSIENLIDNKINNIRLNLSSVLPHELLTPLNGIIGPIQMLLEDYKSFNQSEINELHKVIYFCSQRLKNVTSNLLYFMELENRSLAKNSSKAKVEINNVGHFIELLAKQIAKEYSHGEDLKLTYENHFVYMSEDDFKKLLLELVGNAFKFSTKGTDVNISAKKVDDKFVISIKDYGKGMTDDQIKGIGAYTQFDRHKYEQQGLGLGLYISKKICELNQIDFQIDSKLNSHTNIILTFGEG